MRKNPRYYVKQERLTHKMAYQSLRAQKSKAAREKQSEADRSAVTLERRNRDSALDNPQALLFKSRNSKTIHYFSCEHIREIPDHTFSVYNGSITKESKLCFDCKRLVWISLGIEDQRNSVSIINAFFRYIRVSDSLLEELFLDIKAKVRLIDTYRIQITVNGEQWILMRNDTNHKVKILHNNYCVSDSGVRVPMAGFHEQYSGNELIGGQAIRCILNYRPHL
ncbi:MAG: hypothetical protein MJ094_01315 [Saccharofermentans sp.]|nr:hypothetical protein [Saccharofermentans sp.]